MNMMLFDWDPKKNEQLRRERGVSFEEAAFSIQIGKVLATIRHPKGRHRHQMLAVIEINNYAYVVPYVEKDEKIFLKTIFPSRKYTKKYLPKENKDGSV